MTDLFPDDKTRWLIHNGDCLEVLKGMPDESVDAVISDPPYGLSGHSATDVQDALRAWLDGKPYLNKGSRGFMNCSWDSFVPGPEVWRECFRVLKPGGHLLAFAGTRTQDLMGIAIRLAGFDCRDEIRVEGVLPTSHVISWAYGSGFPKSLSVPKATQGVLDSRYGTLQCDCMDTSDGVSSRNEFGRQGRKALGSWGGPRPIQTEEIGSADVSVIPSAGSGSVRGVWERNQAEVQAPKTVQTPILLSGVRELFAEEAGHDSTPIWTGVEEPSGGDSQTGCELSIMREDARAEWRNASCSPSEALPLRGEQPPEEPSGPMRPLPPYHRGSDHVGFGLDINRREPRRVISDDLGGGQDPMARICSWCGLPDKDWLNSLKPLGTALKPAHEPVLMYRKPLVGTVAQTVQQYGTGAINIDGCRVSTSESLNGGAYAKEGTERHDGAENWRYKREGGAGDFKQPTGRWPSNLILCHNPSCKQVGTKTVEAPAINRFDDGMKPFGEGAGHAYTSTGGGTEEIPAWECVDGCPVKALDGQSGEAGSWSPAGSSYESTVGLFGKLPAGTHYGDTGGASRFFPQFQYTPEDAPFRYVPKANRTERNEGLDGKAAKQVDESRDSDAPGANNPRNRGGRSDENHHPCVKPIELMRWLVRLVTQPGGIVLDPFNGSGSTGCAAILEGMRYVGIELDPDYAEIARTRITHHELKGRGGIKNPWTSEAPRDGVAVTSSEPTSLESLFDFDG